MIVLSVLLGGVCNVLNNLKLLYVYIKEIKTMRHSHPFNLMDESNIIFFLLK